MEVDLFKKLYYTKAMIRELWEKYKKIIAYLFWGVCTTALNYVTFLLTYHFFKLSPELSTVIAWCVAVLFAFVSNKLWVFASKSFSPAVFIREALSFFACRLATGALDVGIMHLMVTRMGQSPELWKILSNIIVIVLNYIAARFVIFNFGKKDTTETEESIHDNA